MLLLQALEWLRKNSGSVERSGYVGLRLAPCESGVVEVLENSDNFSFRCDQYSGTVTWSYKTRTVTAEEQTIGTCGASSCQPNTGLPPGLFSLTFVSASSSRLSLTNQVTARRYGITYRCADSQTNHQCQVNVVSHAVVPPSGLNISRARWDLKGSSGVTSVYSSLGRYSCSWTERSQSKHLFWRSSKYRKTAIPSVKLTLTPDISNTSNTQNRTGTCTFSKGLPTDDGNYTYNVGISPGNTQRSGNVEIVRPVAPTVTCSPRPYVPENTNVSCTCTTQNVGRPEGRLRWFRGSGNNKPINNGAYGGSSLIMTPQKLTLNDHNVTTFRCDVEWVETISGAAYTASVGYSPTALKFTLSASTVNEGQSVTFHCQADGRPTPTMTLVDQDSNEEVTQESPISHTVSHARCEDAGNYRCSAGNTIGSNQTESRLLVNCKPREAHADNPTVNFQDKAEFVHFTVTAFPTPESYSFMFLGDTRDGSPQEITDEIDLSVTCQQNSRPVYQASCSITIDNVTSPDAAGFYRLTLSNSQGNDHFDFQVKVNATEDASSSLNGAAIAGGVVAAVVAAGIVVAVSVVVLRRRKASESKKQPDETRLSSGGLSPQDSEKSADDKTESGSIKDMDVTRDVYAVVNKPQKTPAQSGDGPSDVATYAVVNKPSKSAASAITTASKPKVKKDKKRKNKNMKSDITNPEHEYGNITLSMSPPGSEGTMTTSQPGKKPDKKPKKPTSKGAARQANQDGLMYTMVDFSGQGQQSTKPAPPPDQQGVVYSDVLFDQPPTTQ
ncbi:hypothetical protein BaRGS_00037017 [Batillaria attramentaria]|uniref:Ig-like domain-containing protein n=1 Tax=Batillaria attramentaria TaxID=370345 RepID=A0ABD0J9U4_9CAEN